MSDFLMRDGAPLSAEEWKQVDSTVIHVAQQFLVGRRFIELAGPLGAGTEVVPVGAGASRKYLEIKTIQQDFTLFWQDIEANRRMGAPIELGAAAAASAKCAQAEDKLIFDTMLKAKGTSASLGDWSKEGSAFEAIVAATTKLTQAGFFAPYAVVVSADLYTKTQRVVQAMGRLESKLIKNVTKGGLFLSPSLGASQGLVISLGAHNLDLVVAQDLVTGYMGNEALDHLFRVMESLVLRIKRPGAICKLDK